MPAKVGVLSPTRTSKAALRESLRKVVERGFCVGKAPLFVLGAGISAGRVPFIGEMATRLVTLINNSDQIRSQTKEILMRQGGFISAGRASRSDAAEFFSTCQIEDEAMSDIWRQFCRELALDGLPSSDGNRFRGLFLLTDEPDPADSRHLLCGPSLAHIDIASLMTVGACHVLNLNYDPLLFLAMSHVRQSVDDVDHIPNYHMISLHTENDIVTYYSSTNRDYQPAVVNARGDIFYAHCTNTRCPEFTRSRSLDTRYATHQKKKEEEAFRCSSCHLKSIRLQLSFPGYETKERLVEPVLHRLRDFLGHRVSVIIPVGLSGQWDPYLLSEIFDWALAYSIPVVDVKPERSKPTAFEAFRHRYFPSIPVGAGTEGAWYQQWRATADEFMHDLHRMIQDTGEFTLLDVTNKRSEGQSSLGFS